MIHQPQLDVQSEQQTDPVDQSRITDDRDHRIHGTHGRYKSRKQVQHADGSRDPGFDKPQIQCQKICQHNGDHNRHDDDKQGVQQVVSLCGFGKKVGIVCCGKCAGILILKTLDHCGYDRISDCQHYYQECRQHHSVRCQQSFCLILHICSFGSDSSSEFRSRYPIFR